MALDTAQDGYERVYKASGPEDSGKYYEGYVEKKEKFNKWVKFWCVLKEQNIYFFKDNNTHIRENFVGFLHLEQPTSVDIIKSKEGKYEWTIKSKSGKVALRTYVASLREGWISAMDKSLKHEPPTKENYIIGDSRPISPKKNPSSKKTHTPHYVITEGEMATLKEHSVVEKQVEMTEQEKQIQLELQNGDKSWYQASHRREDAERILSSENNGVFIVRDFIDVTSSRHMGFVISLKDEFGQIRHHKIQKAEVGLIIKGYEGKYFDTLLDLLKFFMMSQRKKLTLVPFNPKKPYAPPAHAPPANVDHTYEKMDQKPPSRVDQGYEDMESPKRKLNGISKARSKSFQDRALPPTPPAPTKGMARANTIQDRRLPTPPPCQSSDDHQSSKMSYVPMQSPFKDRSLPPTPPQDNAREQRSPEPQAGGCYVNYQAPGVPSRVPPVPSPPADLSYVNYQAAGAFPGNSSYINYDAPRVSPASPGYENYQTPKAPHGSTGYVNYQPPGAPVSMLANENIQNTHVVKEPAPALPPKQRAASVKEINRYVNLPGSNVPDRIPLRKTNTLS